jgi:hypothetical protein
MTVCPVVQRGLGAVDDGAQHLFAPGGVSSLVPERPSSDPKGPVICNMQMSASLRIVAVHRSSRQSWKLPYAHLRPTANTDISARQLLARSALIAAYREASRNADLVALWRQHHATDWAQMKIHRRTPTSTKYRVPDGDLGLRSQLG